MSPPTPSPTIRTRTRSAVAQVWTRRRGTLLARVAVLEEAVQALGAGTLSLPQRRAAEREAHQLVGSAGTFGFSRATAAALQLERVLSGSGPLSEDTTRRIAAEMAALRQDLEGEPFGGAATGAAEPAAIRTSQQLVVAVRERSRFQEIAATASARGLEVVAVTTPEQARALSEAPVAAVVDLALPEDGGLHLLAEFQSWEPPVVTLAVTPGDGFTDRVEAARSGAQAFLSDAVPAVDVLDAVEGVLHRRRTAGTTVLAVDDDPTVLEALEAVLGAAGLRTVCIGDPQRFWSALEQEEPDLVILNLDMPTVTGDQLCRVIRNDPRWARLPIVFLTARSDPATVSEVFSAGADDFVAKPFVGPELLARINNRLERVRLFQAYANTDPLTGLSNRRQGKSDLQRLLDLARRHKQPLSLAVLDLDQFKQVNDRHGHDVGDEVLRCVGSVLAEAFRGEDVAARWGGEEFVIGLYGMRRDDAVERLATTLETLREQRFDAPSGPVSVSFSGGVAVYPEDADTLRSLYQVADHTLYRAKEAGRDRVLAPGRPGENVDVDVVLVGLGDALGQSLSRALTTRGYRTRPLHDIGDAHEQLAGTAPALRARALVVDTDRCGASQLALLRALAETDAVPGNRMVLIASADEDAGSGSAEVSGALAAPKPVSVSQVMNRIRRALST